MQRLDFRAMGCQMFAAVDTPPGRATEILAQVPEWFAKWERHLSRFLPESELKEINRVQGKPVVLSGTTAQVLEQALAAAQVSAGLVTPCVLDALTTAGYDQSFELIRPLDSEIRPANVPDWRAIQFDGTTRTVQMPRGMRLDFGGIAKGWAADQAVHGLAPFGPALVDAGGDIAASGPMANGEPWLIGIADPLSPEHDIATLLLERGGVATSGRDYRRWQRNGRWQHHIIDPRTALPAQTDVLSATVVASSTLEAEVAAKVALILGSDDGLEWLEAHGALAGLLTLEDGRILQTPSMAKLLVPDAPASLEVGFTPAVFGGTHVVS